MTVGSVADVGGSAEVMCSGLSIPVNIAVDQSRALRLPDAGGDVFWCDGSPPARAQEYRVSWHTIRAALRSLRTEGLITAARGRASSVAEPTLIQQQMGGALYSLLAFLEAAGLIQSIIVRCLDIRADGVVGARLGLEESTPLLHLERLRLAGEEPLAVDRGSKGFHIFLRGQRSGTSLDEQQLGPFGLLHEISGADDALYLVVEVCIGEVVHVGGHAAGPKVTSGGDDQLEEFRYLGNADLSDGLLQFGGCHRGHPR